MIGNVAGDDKPAICKRGPSGHKTAIGLGVASLWLMNVSVNVVMGPARAIINDLVESSYLVTANSIATGVMGTSFRCIPHLVLVVDSCPCQNMLT